MVFGFLVDVPLLTATFALILVFRRNLATIMVKTGLPRFLLFLLLAIPLIIFEEQIDCMPAWCGKVVIPPTLYFLEFEVFILGLLVILLHSRSALRVALAFSIYGVFFEHLLGGLRGLPPSLVALFLVPYVAMGYGFVSLLPLEVLLGREREGLSLTVAPGTKGGAEASALFARIKVAMKLAVKAAGDWW